MDCPTKMSTLRTVLYVVYVLLLIKSVAGVVILWEMVCSRALFRRVVKNPTPEGDP